MAVIHRLVSPSKHVTGYEPICVKQQKHIFYNTWALNRHPT
ncbi:hypothetical protein PCIT_a3402 [Pseudoalteromonas citrea]|uniref:Uncharacterized protein n=1 Tax=Pseudoalteromonas citrea TaxID=43655 RepID=A0AAD4AGX5_9GAMM|nr:hypothetical protein PCIT_a3402 [Pseudoalteromonas citrea]